MSFFDRELCVRITNIEYVYEYTSVWVFELETFEALEYAVYN